MIKIKPNDFFNLIGKERLSRTDHVEKNESLIINGFKVYKDSWRYRTFYQKGCTCSACGKKGTYFLLTKDKQNSKRAHFNLYADDGTLMTKDHIYPKSLGGKNSIDNFQTMCTDCNVKKGNKIEKIEEV